MLPTSVIFTFLISQQAVSWAFSHHKNYLPDDYSILSSEQVPSEEASNTESSENSSKDESKSSGEKYADLCPDKEESLVSPSDIKYKIDDIACTLQLENNIKNSHMPEAEDVGAHYLKELEEFQQHIVDRPTHLLHIMEDIVDTRHRLEPKVYEMLSQIYDSDIVMKKYSGFSEQAETLLKKIEKSKRICQINCEHPYVESRFGRDIFSHPFSKHLRNKNMTCIRLKDLQDYVTAVLTEFDEELGKQLHWQIEEKKQEYEQKLECLKNNLKDAAVKQFGTTMYDILTLQDDIYHLDKYVQEFSISAEINMLEENTAQLKLKLIGLKRAAEKYRQFCFNCNNKQRARRDSSELRYDYEYSHESASEDSNEDENHLEGSNIIDILIQEKKDEILERFRINFDEIFQQLDAQFDDPDVIEDYVSKLEPVQHDIDYHVEQEQNAIHDLRQRFEQSEIHEIHRLLNDSNRLLQVLEYTQHFVNRFT